MGQLGLNSSAGLFNYTIPNAPTGFGIPLIFSTINASMNGNIYIVMTNPTGPTTFQYYKRYLQSGDPTARDATAESFNFMAVWL